MNKWFKSLSTTLLAVVLLTGMTACEETRVRSVSYGSSYSQPYDYYYYPESRVYLNISTGYYFYPYKNSWRKVRSLPRSYHLDRRDRVKMRIKSKDRPYTRHSEHRTKYAPRKYNRDKNNYRNINNNKNRTRNINNNKNRTKVITKKSYDYYYYPQSRIYYDAKSKYYYYPGGKNWNRTKRVPSNYRLKHNERVKVKVNSRSKPYLNNSAHRARYVPRKNYTKGNVKRNVNFSNKIKLKDYEKGGK